MKFDVIGLDSPCVDLAVNVRCFPKPNGAERIQNLSWQGGGKVASGMVAAANLIMFIPNLVIFICMQSKVMNTMASSGIK